MQSNRLEADEVVAGRDRGRDRGRPRGVVSDHLAVGPAAIEDGTREKTGFVNLEPLERVRADASAGRARALGEVRELQ